MGSYDPGIPNGLSTIFFQDQSPLAGTDLTKMKADDIHTWWKNNPETESDHAATRPSSDPYSEEPS